MTAGSNKRAPRRTSQAVSVLDVAREARVSTATVSRVLNGSANVGEPLASRVRAVAVELGYTPHAAARALATQRSTTIGAVIPSLENQNFARGVFALQKRIVDAGYTLLLACSYYDPEEELKQVHALVADGIAGLMLVGRTHAPALYQLLAKKNIPFVNCWTVDSQHPYVGFDNVEIGRRLADYLFDLGHRNFGIIVQRVQSSDRAADRISGVREALAARGLELKREHLIETPHRSIEGQNAMKSLMQGPNRPSAVICGTDVLAIGALVQARQSGIEVPRDVSIVGIDDIEFASFTTPPLTTMRLPAEEVGTRSAEYLLDRIAGRSVSAANTLSVDLIVRGTAAAPREH
ncbi:LacI family DNA-binding transcriptional regulator [Trinickia mobilis]|uniref:LacI family DNA-binding transcriptional regulator n=1 Tax=Trinickia mobilis TaxID=2816356 RepID=UPI001A8F4BDC|nr:LacI family DNA-binding transcriptional regulator [Trinickia mobilis]